MAPRRALLEQKILRRNHPKTLNSCIPRAFWERQEVPRWFAFDFSFFPSGINAFGLRLWKRSHLKQKGDKINMRHESVKVAQDTGTAAFGNEWGWEVSIIIFVPDNSWFLSQNVMPFKKRNYLLFFFSRKLTESRPLPLLRLPRFWLGVTRRRQWSICIYLVWDLSSEEGVSEDEATFQLKIVSKELLSAELIALLSFSTVIVTLQKANSQRSQCCIYFYGWVSFRWLPRGALHKNVYTLRGSHSH